MTRTLVLCSMCLAGCAPALDLDSAALHGSLGEVEEFDAPVEAPYAYGDFGNVAISLDATDSEGRWALARVKLPNDFVDWEPGRYWDVGDILGCSTNPDSQFMYDRHADRVEIFIAPGETPEQRTVFYTGTWYDDGPSGQHLTGQFDYTLTQ